MVYLAKPDAGVLHTIAGELVASHEQRGTNQPAIALVIREWLSQMRAREQATAVRVCVLACSSHTSALHDASRQTRKSLRHIAS